MSLQRRPRPVWPGNAPPPRVQRRCAHPRCHCPVDASATHCSSYCANVDLDREAQTPCGACACGHTGCKHEAAGEPTQPAVSIS